MNKKFTKRKLTAKLLLFALVTFSQWLTPVMAQLTGTKNIPGDYATISAAVTDLNTQGVGPGGVTFMVAAGSTETAPAGGISITATGTAANPIVFQKSGAGANPLVSASNTQVAGSIMDAIVKLVGADYVTFDGIDVMENAANTTAAPTASNNMTEFGYALFYTSLTNGSQNNTIRNCAITLNRTYQNTFGIYSTSRHSSTSATTTADITDAVNGPNHNNHFYTNTISNVNMGIVVIGSNTAANFETGLDIGGGSLATGNTITNYGTTSTFSGYVSVSGTVNGILVSNINNLNISYNTITSSVGAVTSGTLRGIFIDNSGSNTPVGTIVNNINFNNISIQSGASGGAMQSINYGLGNTTTTLNINSNNFHTSGHTVASSGAINFIQNAKAGLANLSISNNTFTNLTVNTTGNVNFINSSQNHGTNAVINVNGNSIVTAFNKTGAGGTVQFYNSNGSTPSTATEFNMNNNFSNVTLTGGTTLTGWQSTDGATIAPFGPAKTVTGNTFSNITGGTNAVIVMTIANSSSSATNMVANNTITNVTGGANVTGITSANGTQVFSQNTIRGIGSTGTSITVNGLVIGGGTIQRVERNKIADLSNNQTGATVNGILVSSGTTVTLFNNTVGNLNATAVSGTNPVNGINLTSSSSSTNINVYYNTVFLSGTSSGTNFGSSGIFHTTSGTATTATLDLRNNIIVNNTTPTGTGFAVAYRRSGTALNNYASTSNNNLFYAGTPGTNRLIFYDGTNSDQTLAGFKTRVGATRESVSQTENVAFTSTTGSSSSFLHVNTATPSYTESGGANIATYTNDFDGDIRQGNIGYAGAGTAPDMGADEFEGIVVPQCTGMPITGTIAGTASICTGTGTSLSLTGASSDIGISYQWASSTTAGGPYTTMLGTALTQSTGALTTTTYYVVTSSCSFSGMSATSAPFTLTINSLPTIAVSPASATYCAPGGPAVALTASGAATYSWSPATGLSANTGTTVNATPTLTTVYTVTGTDGSGCINSTTVAVTVAPSITMGTVTATPASVCAGGSTSLAATASVANTYVVQPIAYAPVTDPGGTVLVTGDDAMSAAIPIPFTFTYFGTTYTQLFACSNGFVQLGTLSGPTNVYAQSIPSTTTPNNVIAGVWSDLNINPASGGVRSYVTGTAGNQVLTIHFFSCSFYATTINYTGNVDFYISLFEADSHVEIHVNDATGVSTTTANKTLGLENAAGTTALSPSGRNAANWNVSAVTHEAWKFTPSGALTYTWTEMPAAGTLASTTGNPVIANSILTNATYTATAHDAFGCTATGNVNVVAGAALVCSGITKSSPTTCAGSSLTLTSNHTGGGAPYSHSWSDGSATVYPDAPSIAVTLPAGTYNFTVTVTDGCGNTCNSIQTVVIDATPTASVSGPVAALCSGANITLDGITNVGTSFTWTGPNGLNVTTEDVNITSATTAATGTYTFTSTLGACTSAPATFAVIVNPSPLTVTANLSSAAICDGESVNLTSTANNYGTLLSENFNATPAGWTTVNNSTGGTPANAAWILRNSPYSPAGSWTGSISSNDNTQYYFTNGDAAGNGSTTNTILQTPSFSTIGFTAVTLNLFHFYRDVADAGDNAYIEVSTNGSTWTTLQTYTSTQGAASAFASANINLNAYAGNATVYVRFRYTGTWDWGWAIDNVSIVATPATYTYAWTSVPAGFTSTDQNPVGVVPTATTAYTVTATNAFNCSLSATTNLTVNPLPTVSASSDAAGNAVCNGDDIVLSGSGADTYVWDNSVNNGVAFVPGTSTVYTVTGTNTATGCDNTAAISVTVNTLPTVSASSDAVANTICEGSDVTLNGGGADNYVWDNSVTDGDVFTPTTTTTYNVTGTDAATGCENTAAITVTVNGLPTVTASSDAVANTICEGSDVTLNGGGADNYVWDNSVTDGDAFTPTTTTTYNVTGTDAATGCENTAAITITVNGLPAVTASSDAVANTICEGSDVTLNGGGADNYVWDNSVNDGDVFTPTTTTTYNVTGTDAATGCENTAAITITVNGLPAVTASSDAVSDMICEGSDVTLNGGGADNYVWDNSVTDGDAFTPTTTTTYNVTGTDAATGCENTAAITITVNGLPTVTASSDAVANTICEGSDVTLNGGGADNYVWDNSVNDGDAFSPTTTTTYNVTGTDAATGCENTAAITITVNGLPAVTASSDAVANTICEGSDVTLNGGGADGYVWDNSVTDGDAFNPTTTTTYTVTGTDAATGCENTAAITITVNGLPAVTASSDAVGDMICEGSDVTLNGGGADNYVWDNSVTDGDAFTPTTTTTYNVTGTDAATGCENTAAITITVNIVDVTTTVTGVDITANSATGTYQWINCATNLPIPGETNATFTATSNGNYAVIVTDNGCSDTSGCVPITGLGIAQLNNAVFAVYPNPTSGAFTVESSTDANVTLVSALGDVVMSARINSGKNALNTGEIARGMYLVKITDLNGNLVQTQRLTVTR